MRFSVLSLALGLALSAPLVQAEQLLDAVDRDLPEFDLASVDSGQWQQERLLGKPWVINFWASWCPPCVEEIPSMNEAWQQLESQGVGMLAINAGEGRDTVDGFLQRIDIDFPTLMGNADTLSNWSVMALPTTLIVNARGEVVYEAEGPREWNDAALLDQVLALREPGDEAAPAATSD